jgi:hypothetical protein
MRETMKKLVQINELKCNEVLEADSYRNELEIGSNVREWVLTNETLEKLLLFIMTNLMT